jgi:iron-sulfur cluster insertion protein
MMHTAPDTQSPSPPPGHFTLSDSAAMRINHLKQQDGKPGLRFRILVKGGGCSGFQYEFSLDDAAPAADDTVISHNGAEAIIDEVSLGIVNNAMLDYTEDLSSAGFEIKNPNATARCGCGNSFSVAL